MVKPHACNWGAYKVAQINWTELVWYTSQNELNWTASLFALYRTGISHQLLSTLFRLNWSGTRFQFSSFPSLCTRLNILPCPVCAKKSHIVLELTCQVMSKYVDSELIAFGKYFNHQQLKPWKTANPLTYVTLILCTHSTDNPPPLIL